MNFVDDINQVIDLGFNEFKSFIQRKINSNKDYLEQPYWLSNGSQMTLLNYLIDAHQEHKEGDEVSESERDLTQMIDYVLSLTKDINIGEPLHQAVSSGKTRLALHLLGAQKSTMMPHESEQTDVVRIFTSLRKIAQSISETIQCKWFDLNRRDEKGRSLLSLILETKNLNLLVHVLFKQPNLHAATKTANTKVTFQPIHQAVALDYADGIRLLAHEGANLANPVGLMRDTPVLLAARLNKIDALDALLEQPIEKLELETKNNNLFADASTGHTAIEEFCEHIANNGKKEALRGVAMLLCRGAEPPRNQVLRELLGKNRINLLKMIDEYLQNKPELVDAFVNRCHLAESALHNIIYANHSWGSSVRRLFGKPSDAAFMVERLVVRKYSDPVQPLSDNGTLVAASDNLLTEKDPIKLYAEFVRRYEQAYDSQIVTNRWSTMRWMIAEGCDWARVKRYSDNHPVSRTRIVLNEMFNPMPKIHDDMDAPQDESLKNGM